MELTHESVQFPRNQIGGLYNVTCFLLSLNFQWIFFLSVNIDTVIIIVNIMIIIMLLIRLLALRNKKKVSLNIKENGK